MIKTCLDESANQFLECAVYISARNKLIHAMSLDIERPINRAVVVGCAISATRNYLKLHMSRTLKKYSCATLIPKRGSCGLPGCRLSMQYPSINSPELHAPAEMSTALSSVPRYADTTSRDFVPWRFLDAGQLSARVFSLLPASKNQHTSDKTHLEHKRIRCSSDRRYSGGHGLPLQWAAC
jgi:hypothetical protein